MTDIFELIPNMKRKKKGNLKDFENNSVLKNFGILVSVLNIKNLKDFELCTSVKIVARSCAWIVIELHIFNLFITWLHLCAFS